jgi:hypothetical protein
MSMTLRKLFSDDPYEGDYGGDPFAGMMETGPLAGKYVYGQGIEAGRFSQSSAAMGGRDVYGKRIGYGVEGQQGVGQGQEEQPQYRQSQPGASMQKEGGQSVLAHLAGMGIQSAVQEMKGMSTGGGGTGFQSAGLEGGAAGGPSMVGASGLSFNAAGELVRGGDSFKLGGTLSSPYTVGADGAIEGGVNQAQGPGTGGSAEGASAGAAAGLITSYLINRYTNAPEGVAPIAGATVGGAVSGGVGGVGAAGASAGSGGAAAGSAGAVGGGAIMGGAGGVIAYSASKIIGKHVFGAGKQSGRDYAASKFYGSYHGSKRYAKSMGFDSTADALAQPYRWMGQEARNYRSQVAQGKDPAVDAKTKAAFTAPEYRPSEWEAWIGGMTDAGVNTKELMDATAYYMSEAGKRGRNTAAKDEARGKEYWTSSASDIRGTGAGPYKYDYGSLQSGSWNWGGSKGGEQEYNKLKSVHDARVAKAKAGELFTDKERQENWANIQQTARSTELPWMTEEFKGAYEQEYGGMKEAPKLMSSNKFRKQYGSRQAAEERGTLGQYMTNRVKYLEGAGTARLGAFSAAYGPQGAEGIKSRDVSERTGIYSTMRRHDTRDIWGGGMMTYDDDYEAPRTRSQFDYDLSTIGYGSGDGG